MLKLRIVLVCFSLLFSAAVQAQSSSAEAPESLERVLSLVDGAIYRGELIEYVPKSHIVLRLASGDVKRFEWRQVKRVSLVASTGSVAVGVPRPEPKTRPAPLVVQPQAPVQPPPAAPPPASHSRDDNELKAAALGHAQAARTLHDAGRFDEALAEYESAYRLSRSAAALLQIGKIHHRLGRHNLAREFYERYLQEEPKPTPERRAQVNAYIAQLSAYLHPSQPAPPPPTVERSTGFSSLPPYQPQPRHPYDPGPPPETVPPPSRQSERRSVPMMATGLSIMCTSYMAALVTGAILVAGAEGLRGQYTSSSISQVQVGTGVLMIPFVGPFASALLIRAAEWSVPWVFVGGATQLLGLALTISGGRMKPSPSSDIAFVPVLSPQQNGLMVVGRF